MAGGRFWRLRKNGRIGVLRVAMKRVKVRIDAGCVIEQYVYSVPESSDIRVTGPRKPRFKTEEERAEHRRKSAWRDHARKINENFVGGGLYSTLTFDDAHEVHTFQEARRVRDNYFRRLVRACPGAVIFIYMGRGENTSRIHFHMISSGVPKEIIEGKWGQGDINRIEELREHNWYGPKGQKKDHGRDYTGLANYLIGHWTQEQGGHRYKCTRNARVPKPEKPKEVKRDYSAKNPPRAPKGYELVAVEGNQYGYWWFKYVRKPMPKKVGRPRKSTQLKS